eukprot:scaffold73612_cov109-Phaeocystis_antarctica.AAC.2
MHVCAHRDGEACTARVPVKHSGAEEHPCLCVLRARLTRPTVLQLRRRRQAVEDASVPARKNARGIARCPAVV